MFATIENLRVRALALRSSIHNEQQLSAVELAGMCAKKTNELIDVVNDLCAAVDKLAENDGVEFIWDEATESLELRVIEV